MSLIHGIAWLIAALLLVRPMQRHPDWRSLTYINVTLVLATLVAAFVLRGRLSDALVQRIAGAIYFAWFVVMSVRLTGIDKKY
jgi:Na+-translocating ferredoxin:NAD+ oxidoreductase RnfD subunit